MNKSLIEKELVFKAVRSAGAGGQHVNKVSSKVEIYFKILSSKGLSNNEKVLLLQKLSSRLTKDNVLILSCQENRSQHRNKEIVSKRLFHLLERGIIPNKPRKRTKPSKASKLKRLLNKKRLGDKKENRRKVNY